MNFAHLIYANILEQFKGNSLGPRVQTRFEEQRCMEKDFPI
jgi:hypothetical protein